MIGYYVHHRGAGHLHRALAVAAALDEPVTILSSLDAPASWAGEWVTLPMDTDIEPVDAAAGGVFHWVPLDSTGLRSRSAIISHWLDSARPSVVVVDISVEIVALVRLHGIRVVTYAQPGDRNDAPHSLGYRAASSIIAPWPVDIHPSRIDSEIATPIEHVGAISRIPVSVPVERSDSSIAILNGSGGRGESALDAVVAQSMAALPDATWIRLENDTEAVVERTLRSVSLVFGHCGQNAVAEIAATRTPAILVPEERPHDEQFSMAAALAKSGFPLVIAAPDDRTDRAAAIVAARKLDGSGWSGWVDGNGAERAAAVISSIAGRAREGA